jgi:dTMP kinase
MTTVLHRINKQKNIGTDLLKGRFITLEGGEGVGKSSNLSFIQGYLKEKLNQQQLELVITREPGGTPLAEEIRALFVEPRDEAVDENTELLLVFAARAQHLSKLIVPTLESGNWVLSDRFTDATYAYQGGGRGLSMETIASLESIVQKDLRPDLTILLDLSVEQGMQRARDRSDFDRIEKEKISFFEEVRQAYLDRAKSEPERFAIVDASKPLEDVQNDIAIILDKFLEANAL